MSTSDQYFKTVSKILLKCEEILGVYTSVGGETLENITINRFCPIFSQLVKDNKNSRELSIKSGSYLASLAYLDYVTNFENIKVLDFGVNTNLDILAGCLIPYNNIDNINKKTVKLSVSVIKFLSVMEKESPKAIRSLNYRCIRLFICFVYLHDYSHASIISRFLLDQIFLTQGLKTSIKQSLRELKRSSVKARDLDAKGAFDDTRKERRELSKITEDEKESIEDSFLKKANEIKRRREERMRKESSSDVKSPVNIDESHTF